MQFKMQFKIVFHRDLTVKDPDCESCSAEYTDNLELFVGEKLKSALDMFTAICDANIWRNKTNNIVAVSLILEDTQTVLSRRTPSGNGDW